MVYGRRYRKRYSKHYRTLSKVNIAANRNARAQSKQIAALNRKVNYIARSNKSEIRTKFSAVTHQFTNSSLATNYYSFSLSPWSQTYTGDDNAAGENTIEGNFNRCKGISFNAIFEYTNDFTGDETDNQLSASYRIVLAQEKIFNPVSEDSITNYQVSDIFNVQSSSTSADTNATIPLVAGITQQFKVLYAKSLCNPPVKINA